MVHTIYRSPTTNYQLPIMFESLLIIPNELLSLILQFLDISSIFSLRSVSKKYKLNNVIHSHLKGIQSIQSIRCIHLDAISNGHLDLFKWFVDKNEVTPEMATDEAYLRSAIENNHLHILQYLHTNGCFWNSSSPDYFDLAVGNGHIEIVKYLYENGCKWSIWSSYLAATKNHLEVLKYLYKKIGYSPNINPCSATAENGHLEVLKYLYENGYEMNVWNCAYAARGGQLDVLKYLHENGCPWDKNACDFAVTYNHWEIMKYLYENECPGSKEMYELGVNTYGAEVIENMLRQNANFPVSTLTKPIIIHIN